MPNDVFKGGHTAATIRRFSSLAEKRFTKIYQPDLINHLVVSLFRSIAIGLRGLIGGNINFPALIASG